ncbi:MAG: methyltransferase [Oscillospiraceae bacterium]|nr:methyltransferase [Oscillospiraceae bacterium]
MSHYFINDNSLNRDLKYIDYNFKGRAFKFATHDGVFSKNRVDYATDILLNTIPDVTQNGALLDIGCGYGCIGIVLAMHYSLKLTQADVNSAAVELTRYNCKYNGVKSNIIESNCFDGISGKFDIIVLNPPIHAGKAVTYKMYEGAKNRLNPGGVFYIVTLKKHGAESTFGKLNEVFKNRVNVIYKKKGHYVFECSL